MRASVLAGPCAFTLEVKKSRFLCRAEPVESAEAALAFLHRIADPAATHNCWAYRIGGQYRFSDDGEPGGTAGRPILAAIDGQGLDRTMTVVTRWFGGVKLGAGGLVRAYGGCDGVMVQATLLENVPLDSEMNCEEVFGPVAALYRFDDFESALAQVNASAFGLQAGVFTCDLGKALRAWDALEVGGVIVGDVPAWRVDNMPYGGVKDSGLGREGIRYAIEDMTEIRLLVIRD